MSDQDVTAQPERGPAPQEWMPGASCPRSAEITALILFGATGDLTQRKLIPAIYALTEDGLLPCGLPIISIGRRARDRGELLGQLRAGADQHSRKRPVKPDVWDAMASNLHYVRGGLDDAKTYAEVKRILASLESEFSRPLNRIFYLAIPPHYFEDVIDNLESSGLAAENHGRDEWPRIVIEKPFGRDLASARQLNAKIGRQFAEDQVFRMDHYLGKETVQNLMVLRFANAIFEPLWNRNYIQNIQITMAETVGLEGRGQYFDKSGTLRDVVQNHLLELLALVAMEPPPSIDSKAIRDEKTKLLGSMHPMTAAEIADSVVRAQYTPGNIAAEAVPGYLEEDGVAPGSATETYAAARLCIDNWRWAGVPFFIRAGKRLHERVTEITVRFKQAPYIVFEGERRNIEANSLVLRIQPNEGIDMCFSAKRPGAGLHIQRVPMEFCYASAFTNEPPEAYERLILDAIIGDGTLFARADSIERSWELMTPILDAWESGVAPPVFYQAGSWGPKEADDLIARDGDAWHQSMRVSSRCEQA